VVPEEGQKEYSLTVTDMYPEIMNSWYMEWTNIKINVLIKLPLMLRDRQHQTIHLKRGLLRIYNYGHHYASPQLTVKYTEFKPTTCTSHRKCLFVSLWMIRMHDSFPKDYFHGGHLQRNILQ
jgi:hypothetical protein